MAMGPDILGHGHPAVVGAVKEQLDNGLTMHVGTSLGGDSDSLRVTCDRRRSDGRRPRSEVDFSEVGPIVAIMVGVILLPT